MNTAVQNRLRVAFLSAGEIRNKTNFELPRLTPCKKGHPNIPENIVSYKKKENNEIRRYCRICENERQRERRRVAREKSEK